MVLDNNRYVPSLAIRASEMNALEFLPGATKDRMTPCILLAPWASSNSLERVIDRVQRAFPNRNYFLDMDRDYQFTNPESPPQQELMQLRQPANAYANWVEFIRQYEHAWPCIQSEGQNEAQIRRQIEQIQALGRPHCMRIVRDRFPNNIDEIVSAFSAAGAADFAVILEGGWTRNPLSLAVWFENVIKLSLQTIDARVPVVVSCTSMPKTFSTFSDIASVPFNNRRLVSEIARVSNRTTVIYGDWASTRPREPSGHAKRPFDRIDYPTEDNWYIIRNRDENWNFQTAARKLIEDDAWNGNFHIWGEEMIYKTTINQEIGIDTPQKNVAARVNIHLHRQAFYGEPGLKSMDFDEDWVD